MKKEMKICVIGSGPTGSILALYLSSLNNKITIYEKRTRDEVINQSRAYALTNSTKRILQNCNLWNSLEQYLVPFKKLYLEDRQIKRKVIFNLNDLNTCKNKDEAIGWIIDHKHLMLKVFEKINDSNNITVNNNEYNSECYYDLTFAADGKFSSIRRKLKINQYDFNYSQGCLSLKVLLRGFNKCTAYEIFRREGPLAVLPMGQDMFQIIWSAPLEICKERSLLSNALLLDRLSTILPYGMEPDVIMDKPTAFSLNFAISHKLGKNNTFLVGESSHSFHPVGGQGLNLCLRDVETIIYLVNQINNSNLTIAKFKYLYHLIRYIDIISVGLITDLLVRTFSSKFIGLLVIRIFILAILNRLSLLRKLSLKIMTYGINGFFKSSGYIGKHGIK